MNVGCTVRVVKLDPSDGKWLSAYVGQVGTVTRQETRGGKAKQPWVLVAFADGLDDLWLRASEVEPG